MKCLSHHETHYTSRLRDVINALGIDCGDGNRAVHVERIEGLSTLNGMADLVGWTSMGHYVAIEVKKHTKNFSALQVRFLNSAPLAYAAFIFKEDDNKVYADVIRWPLTQPARIKIYLGRER